MKKQYKIREGSIAFYCQKYWEAGVVVAAILMLIALVAFCCLSTPEEPTTYVGEVVDSEVAFFESEAYEPEVKPLWDVPLDVDLQLYIYDTAQKYGINPDIVIAVIDVESDFNSDLVGDSGDSVGLMQVQEKWHKERMNKLGVENLLNPYENILVGIDYLAESIHKGGLEWGLMNFNGGPAYANNLSSRGIVSHYAKEVIAITEELN